jgi:hypothetical protein
MCVSNMLYSRYLFYLNIIEKSIFIVLNLNLKCDLKDFWEIVEIIHWKNFKRMSGIRNNKFGFFYEFIQKFQGWKFWGVKIEKEVDFSCDFLIPSTKLSKRQSISFPKNHFKEHLNQARKKSCKNSTRKLPTIKQKQNFPILISFNFLSLFLVALSQNDYRNTNLDCLK